MTDSECSYKNVKWSDWPGVDGTVILCDVHGYPAGGKVYDTDRPELETDPCEPEAEAIERERSKLERKQSKLDSIVDSRDALDRMRERHTKLLRDAVNSGLTQKEIAQHLNISQSAVSQAIGRSPRLNEVERQPQGDRHYVVLSYFDRTYQSADPRVEDARIARPTSAVFTSMEPMTVGVGGFVDRIYEVLRWARADGSEGWVAELGRELTNEQLDRQYPEYPYRIGARCSTRATVNMRRIESGSIPKGVVYRVDVY